MQIVSMDQAEFVLSFSYDELVTINNALNEVCNGVVIPGFESRLGATRRDVERLLASVGGALDRAAA